MTRKRITVHFRERPERKTLTAREQFNLTRRETAELLDVPGAAYGVQPFEARQYRKLGRFP